jgi:hypothetical protein
VQDMRFESAFFAKEHWELLFMTGLSPSVYDGHSW